MCELMYFTSKYGKYIKHDFGLFTSFYYCAICNKELLSIAGCEINKKNNTKLLNRIRLHLKNDHLEIYDDVRYSKTNSSAKKRLVQPYNLLSLYFLRFFPKRTVLTKKVFNKSLELESLKPWKDPESLFCDTKFLDDFFNKKVTRGNECKDSV